jgi:hypothetical protein
MVSQKLIDSSVRDHGVILFIQFSSVASWHCDKSATTCKYVNCNVRVHGVVRIYIEFYKDRATLESGELEHSTSSRQQTSTRCERCAVSSLL